MISDQIGDLLTRIRNAVMLQHSHCLVTASSQNVRILKVLQECGYILGFSQIKDEKNLHKLFLKVNLKYKNKISVIQGTKRISKPGLRIYRKSQDLPKVLNGLGIAVVSTSQGIMSAVQAQNRNLGGEILAYVW